jgi:hypothetical protein
MSELKTSYTSGEILALMAKGAGLALIVLTAIIGFMIVVWVIGGLLPEEARSAVSSATTLLPSLPTLA